MFIQEALASFTEEERRELRTSYVEDRLRSIVLPAAPLSKTSSSNSSKVRKKADVSTQLYDDHSDAEHEKVYSLLPS